MKALLIKRFWPNKIVLSSIQQGRLVVRWNKTCSHKSMSHPLYYNFWEEQTLERWISSFFSNEHLLFATHCSVEIWALWDGCMKEMKEGINKNGKILHPILIFPLAMDLLPSRAVIIKTFIWNESQPHQICTARVERVSIKRWQSTDTFARKSILMFSWGLHPFTSLLPSHLYNRCKLAFPLEWQSMLISDYQAVPKITRLPRNNPCRIAIVWTPGHWRT